MAAIFSFLESLLSYWSKAICKEQRMRVVSDFEVLFQCARYNNITVRRRIIAYLN